MVEHRRSTDAEVAMLVARADFADEMRHEMHDTLERIETKLEPLPLICAEIREMKPHVEDYKRLKQRGVGIGMALAAAGALISHLVQAMASKFIGAPHVP